MSIETPNAAAPAPAPPSSGGELSDQDVLTRGPTYAAPVPPKPRIKWYRCPVPREDLSYLNKRSDFLGFLQTGGFLGLLALSGALAVYSFRHWPWYATVGLLYLHGMFWHFQINAFHELIHDSVFKTRWLNGLFLRIFSFFGMYNHHHFWASHTEHHKYTLHPPDDLEVVLPQKVVLKNLWKWVIADPRWFYPTFKRHIKLALGRIDPGDKWTNTLFPEGEPRRRAMIRWQWILLLGHGAILVASIATGWWIVPLVTTFPMAWGAWLHFFCNASQHIGLSDKTPDFRLCCRTIYLNPFVQFLYWHMNYHTEHHMYAAVPCYKLGKLHRLIKHDMPPCPRGLVATWKHIAGILERQKTEPTYQYVAPVPKRA